VAFLGLVWRQLQINQLSLQRLHQQTHQRIPWDDTFAEVLAATTDETTIAYPTTLDSDAASVPWGNQTADAACEQSPAHPLTWTNFSQRSRLMSDIMQEVVLEPFHNNNNNNTGAATSVPATILAVCRFRDELPFSHHFPHAMQQLYRCVSWWRQQQQQQSPSTDVVVQAVLLWHDHIIPSKNPFLRGFLRLLQESSLRVSLVSQLPTGNRTTLVRVAQVRLDDGGLYDYRLHTPEDAAALREAAATTFQEMPFDDAVCPKVPRITILNRRKKRRILNVDALRERLSSLSSQQQQLPARVRYFENTTFLDQVTVMALTDILVSPHGAQLVSLPFLPPCAVILEVLPMGYFAPEFFGTLAAAAGVRHAYVYLGNNRTREVALASATPASRAAARRRYLCVPLSHLQEAVDSARLVWKQCCTQRDTLRR
jgi:hypothetical protein